MNESIDKVLTSAAPTLRAQVLDPARWFIPQQNAEIPAFTAGNTVDPLIDGRNAFAAIHDAISRAAPDGYIYITAWDLVPSLALLGARRGGRLDAGLTTARTAGTDVRVMLFSDNAAARRTFLSGAQPWGELFIDHKTHGLTGSQHQKSAVVLTREAERIGFVGGIDMTCDRWDTQAHDFPDPDGQYQAGTSLVHASCTTFPVGTTPTGGQPWHDVQLRVRGPAAGDIETNFRQRWNDQHDPPARVPLHVASAAASGTHLVQTLRTIPPNGSTDVRTFPYAFTRGEFGYRLALRKAIGNARDYVFIEDQYFISDEIGGLLAAAMARSPRLHVIVVTAAEPDTPPRDAFDFHQHRVLDAMRRVDASRIHVFHLTNPAGTNIYCHAKICIVDDIWAVVGSCNVSRRSLTNDLELGMAVLDERVEHGRRKYARDLRIDLWREHLGLGPGELGLIDDPLAGVHEWTARAGRPPAQIRVHIRPAGSDSRLWDGQVDPDGTR